MAPTSWDSNIGWEGCRACWMAAVLSNTNTLSSEVAMVSIAATEDALEPAEEELLPPPPPPPPGTQISISLASCYDAPHSHLQASKDLVSPSSPDRGRRQHASM
mmetsp:Transcript_15842/g.25370  ORF Transcript_15842/g.25370 Transcript_15842/m.25370 type:complete len:104 (+) Transcript_15842:1214-1525(+)